MTKCRGTRTHGVLSRLMTSIAFLSLVSLQNMDTAAASDEDCTYYGNCTTDDDYYANDSGSNWTEIQFFQEDILTKFFEETNGARWRIKQNWLSDLHVCRWYGITCWNDGIIRSIELENNKVTGTPPSEIFQFSWMESLTLKDNPGLVMNFDGIENAIRLYELKISGNDLTNVNGIGKATSVEYLHLTDNKLGGSIPDEIYDLKNLKGLYFNFNALTGTISPRIEELQFLEEIYFHHNSLTGPIPSEIGLLSNLETLALAENSFSGTLPTELNNLSNLIILAVQRENEQGSDGLKGPLVPFDNSPFLEELFLSSNSLTGTIPENFLGGIRNRRENIRVDLSHNNFVSPLPNSLMRFPRLQIELADNQIDVLNPNFCNRQSWQGGDVSFYGCDAILCPPGTYAKSGRQSSDEAPCQKCDSSIFYGSTGCGVTLATELSQFDILEMFYHALDGKFWKIQNLWLNPQHSVCQWYGITCQQDLATGLPMITKIILPSNELRGDVPKEIFMLKGLNTLDLGDNTVTFLFAGIENAQSLQRLLIPSTGISSITGLGNAPNLQMLDLSNNENLDASALNEILKLETLSALFINHNEFDGSLPSEIGQLTNLQHFRAYGSGFYGQIPSQIGNIANLLVLDLAENDFTGIIPTELNLLTSLELISIHQVGKSGVGLTGKLPSLSDLAQLTELYLDSNSLTGKLPSDLLKNSNKLDGKITIGLSRNQFEGDIPAEYTRFRFLNIDLTDNRIGGIPQALCNMPSWQNGWAQAFGCDAILCPTETFNTFGRKSSANNPCRPCSNVGTGISPFLGATKCLFENDMPENSVLDQREILEKFFFLAGGRNWNNNMNWLNEAVSTCDWYGVTCLDGDENKITALNLTDNGIVGEFPTDVYKLPFLEILNLKGNSISVSFNGIDQATNLKFIKLSETGLTSFEGIDKAASLEILHATDNDLSGPFPTEILQLTKLKELYLNYNMLTGEIPVGISALTDLEELFLYHNQLTGQIPGSIGDLKNLRLITISVNDLSGTLPEELNELSKLEVLSLEGNNKRNGEGLSGPLLDFADLHNIKEIYLNSNSFTGTIPKTFLMGIDDKSLDVKVDLISNELEGSVPGTLALFQKLQLYVADNRIDSIDTNLCEKNEWMNGDVGNFGCDGILCKPGTFSEFGRHNDDTECQQCTGILKSPYYGGLSCMSDQTHQTILEQQILEDFYDAMDGSNWKVHANWMDSSVSICDWYGVTCQSTEEASVKSISLPRNSLSGTVPTDIFLLPSLREIDFANNAIQFPFDSINQAKNLQYLNLDGTGLTSIKGIENALNLQVLHLSANHFSENKIPDSIFMMKTLEILYLSENSFTGELPENLKLLSELKYFSCFACGLEGTIPEWIGDLSNLEYVRLDENSFSGSLPATLSNLKKLEHLDVSRQNLNGGGGITGSLPELLGCTNIGEIYLYSNSITGTIPASFIANADKAAFIEVDLRFNDITGSIPVELGAFTLLNIDLAGNRIDSMPKALCAQNLWMHGEVQKFKCNAILCPPNSFNPIGRKSSSSKPCMDCPKAVYFGSTTCDVTDNSGSVSFGEGSAWEILELFYQTTRGTSWVNNTNWLEGDNPCDWFGIECSGGEVVKVSLENNGVTGTFTPDIYKLSSLEELNLKSNRMMFGFEGIENAKNLKTLVLSDTGLESLEGIGNAVALEYLHITDNELSGRIPTELFDVTSLKSLFANFNNFFGQVPTEIGKLEKLSELFLFHNRLSGQLPSELGLLSNLETITLSENSFTGTIPTELNNLSKMKTFSIQKENGDAPVNEGVRTGLSGPLLSFWNWKEPREIYLGSNMFTGMIPSDFLSGVNDKAQQIKLDLTLNRLTGTIPKELAAFDKMRIYAAGNQFSGIGDGLCQMKNWLSGSVEEFNCDAILCPPNTYNEYGRQPAEDFACMSCEGSTVAPYYGSLQCDDEGLRTDLTEFDILQSIYDNAGGIDWTDNNNWGNKGVSICDWYGVVCASDEGGVTDHVTKLMLSSNNLAGSMPEELFLLPSLTILELQNNPDLGFQFIGAGRASKLTTINVDQTKLNSLVGIGSASPSLVSLSMQNNDFGGVEIPSEMFEYRKLKYLNIANSNLKGMLPAAIGGLIALEEFHCAGNDLTGQIPNSIGNLSQLQVLAMSENDFSGTLPSELGELRHLKGIYLDSFSREDGGIGGPLLPFSNSPDLVNIYIGNNRLTGTIPKSFADGINDPMQEVNIMLKSNTLTGTIPATLARFKKLNIDLAGNRIEGMHPDLCNKREWMGGKVADYACDAILCPPGTFNQYGRQSMDESPCQECVKGTISLPFYGALQCGSKIKDTERVILEKFYNQCGGEKWKNSENWLNSEVDYCDWYGITCHDDFLVDSILLGSNNIVGETPKELYQLENLQWLWLYSNPVNVIFDGIENAKKLSSLLLDSTTTSSINGIGKATSLTELDLRFNHIDGTIPDAELHNLTNLVSLSLSDNRFSGSLPSALDGMVQLKKLRLGNNFFTGTLPDFASHAVLKSIDLSNNDLTGAIPENLLEEVDLDLEIFLDLSTNKLTGTIPGALSRFGLMTIYLRDNQISGIDPHLCGKGDWMGGDVGDFDCDGLLCKPGFFSELGRESKTASCMPCDTAEHYGSTNCGLAKAISSSTRLQIGKVGTIISLTFGLGFLLV